MIRKVAYLFIILLLSLSTLIANDVRGITTTITDSEIEVIGKAKEYIPPIIKKENPISLKDREGWALVDSVNFDSFTYCR